MRGIANNLKYLKDLGIEAVWINSFYASPLVDFGYDVSDFLSINPEYGMMDDFEYLIQQADEHELKIILDLIPNHSSDEHEWFNNSVQRIEPFTNYYVWHEGKNEGDENLPPSNWRSIRSADGSSTSAWTWNEVRGEFYYHKHDKTQPDLNFREPRVVEEIEKIMKFWLDKGIYGFRIDAASSLLEVAIGEDGNFPDEPPSGLTDDNSSYNYLNHIYTVDQDESFELIYKWRKFIDDYNSVNAGDTR